MASKSLASASTVGGTKNEDTERNLGWIGGRKQVQITAQLVALGKKCGCCTVKEKNRVVAFKDTSFKKISRIALSLNVSLGIAVCH